VSKIDQFESAFSAAAKPVYHHVGVALGKVLVFTDLDPKAADAWGAEVQRFLHSLTSSSVPEWRVVPGRSCDTIGEVLAIVAKEAPDLVVTYRNLHSEAWQWPHSLSDHLEVLTQVADAPVLLLPRPDREGRWDHRKEGTNAVMALTDHLAGDDSLVNWSVAFASQTGRLWLAHIEDDATFERYIGTIGRIPEIDTDFARERIKRQLLKEPRDYITRVADVLARDVPELKVEAEVLMGHLVSVVKDLVNTNHLDLLVLHTRDEDQLAMHGLSYPLTVELRDTPLLLL
jgi:hypothetical protein